MRREETLSFARSLVFLRERARFSIRREKGDPPSSRKEEENRPCHSRRNPVAKSL